MLSHHGDAIVYPPKWRRWAHPATAAGLLAVTAGGCGSAASSTSPTVGHGVLAAQVMSASCSSAATVAVSSGVTTTEGRRGAGVSSCVFVLTDGRRFKCSGPAFARSTSTPAKLEHAKACVIITPLMLPATVRALVKRIAAARTCLASNGLRVTGGPVFPPQGANSADGELISEGALIAFYTDQRKAKRLEPQVKQNAKRFNGQVVPNDAVTVLWIRPPARGLRNTVSRCALG